MVCFEYVGSQIDDVLAPCPVTLGRAPLRDMRVVIDPKVRIMGPPGSDIAPSRGRPHHPTRPTATFLLGFLKS